MSEERSNGRRRMASLALSDKSKGSQASSRGSPALQITDRDAESVEDEMDEVNIAGSQDGPRKLDKVLISAAPSFDRDAYKIFDENRVAKVLDEDMDNDGLVYNIRYSNGRQEQVPFDKLISLQNGEAALDTYQANQNSAESEVEVSDDETFDMPRRSARQESKSSLIQLYTDDEEDEDEEMEEDSDEDVIRSGLRKRQPPRREMRAQTNRALIRSRKRKQSQTSYTRSGARSNGTRRSIRFSAMESGDDEAEEDDHDDEDDDISDDDDGGMDILRSDIAPHKRRRLNRDRRTLKTTSVKRSKPVVEGTRRSERANRASNNMEEIGIEDIYRSDSDRQRRPVLPKPSGARETFQSLPPNNKFRSRHMRTCESCRNSHATAGQMIFCQGCSLTYHRTCLGPRNGREHLVTKVGEDNFVLQCRRCVNAPQKKDPYAPDLARCQSCRVKGQSCVPFRTRKTTAQEQKEREENGGEDPIYVVPETFLNNPDNVLFRCIDCSRACHFHHLEPRNQYAMHFDEESEQADARFQEYQNDWKCKECAEMPGKVGGIVAWRPTDVESYQPTLDVGTIEEDDKEYLIRWQDFSYFRAQWMPGAWTWGVVSHTSRNAFFKRYPAPKMRTEDAIPEEWLRIDIVLDVKYTNKIDFHNLEVDKARIKEVDTALLKYKGLGYEDAVWERVPSPEDGDRWTDFVTAYNDWVLGRYTTIPSTGHLKDRTAKIKAKGFQEKKEQPSNLEGGELMKYQLEGLNWLYYQWFQQKNGILADEMGLGKTIQVIAFLAMMVQDLKCYPFLVVVPNATCPNWRREIKQWAPSLRVVTYYGSATAREMAYKYELYPGGSKTLKCHVVITSYEAATDESSRKLLRSVSWQGLIVDEGQRLKNDQSLLHNALNALKIPFRILLTGTPLQNNARELFNLLQFLDDTLRAEDLEKEFEVMTNEKITQLHGLIRPFILRRTKVQVLDFLPAMAQIILPVSMSLLQKKTYKSILEQKPELLKSLLSEGSLKASERVGLNNILMQLRKCLCHPFVFNKAIEERHLESHLTHKNLVEASSKLQLLELLLPKLRDRGHRVLIFSQFLDMLDITEDFLDGMGMLYQRLDGSISALEKQKRIDEFNAPSSPLFAFLLSTRAGGVGINLATADTVIILDPDFNPHQDIQAISRAHRIGQTKKVLCFQLMTRASVEEKIMQQGRKKMALDEVVINQLDDEDVEEKDMESILKHGMAELFDDDNADQVIRYDENSIEKLLDRSQIENTKTGTDDTAESQFSFARVWENDTGALADSLNVSETEAVIDQGLWDKILKDRERKAAERAAQIELGRGKRARQTVDYNIRGSPVPPGAEGDDGDEQVQSLSPAQEPALPTELGLISIAKPKRKRRAKGQQAGDDSDTDFQLSASEDSADEAIEQVDPQELAAMAERSLGHAPSGLVKASASQAMPSSQALVGTATAPTWTGQPATDTQIGQLPKPVPKPAKKKQHGPRFKRVTVPPIPPRPVVPPGAHPDSALLPNGKRYPRSTYCPACSQTHPQGSCPLKVAGTETCNICGLAHFGHGRICPHFKSETMVRKMLDELKLSSEPGYLVGAAMKYLKGLKGHLVQNKRLAKERAMNGADAGSLTSMGPAGNTQAAGVGVNFRPYQPAHTMVGQQGQDGQMLNANPQLQAHQQPPQGSVAWQNLPVEQRLAALQNFQAS